MGLTTRRLGDLRVAAAVAALAGPCLLATGCGSGEDSGSAAAGSTSGSSSGASTAKYTVGVSNTLVGNGWREEMICAAKAQALSSGAVSKVVVANQNGGAPEQISSIRNLISSGVKAIVVNPADAKALNPVFAQAKARGVTVVAVDQAVDSPSVLNVTNDQEAYGRLGGEWLAKKLGGKGNLLEMRGIAGAPADTARHKGFTEAVAKYPGLKVVKQVFTGWQFGQGGKQALDILQSGAKVDGIWTSGIDYTVVNALKTAKQTDIPVVGADTNAFLGQLLKGAPGAAVSNPAAIGGVGTRIALDALQGKKPPKDTTLTPVVWDADNKSEWQKYYDENLDPTYSSQLEVKPYTSYTVAQLRGCQGPN